MPKKKIKKSSKDASIAKAALSIAAQKGWPAVTCDAIAKQAKIPAAAFRKRFSAPHDVVPVIVEELAREASVKTKKQAGSEQDVLFDLLMARFDIMQKHKKAVLSIADAALGDAVLAKAFIRATFESMNAAIETPFFRPALAAGLGAVYAYAFFVWSRDETRDMAKTMAALDRGLRLVGKASEFLRGGFDARER